MKCLQGVIPALAAILALGTATPALAHRMNMFATVEGDVISGYVYFTPGGRASEVTVTAADPDGSVLASTLSDQEGNFRISPRIAVDHHLSAESGDGHVARFKVSAAELPGGLRPAAGTPPAPAASASPAPAPAATAAALPAEIEVALARQIRPLREQLDAYQEKIWMHDVLGGLGVIAGIGGIAFGLAARSRREGKAP